MEGEGGRCREGRRKSLGCSFFFFPECGGGVPERFELKGSAAVD